MDKDLLTVAEDIRKTRAELESAPISSRDGNYLSAAAVKLALLKMTLATHLADLESELEADEAQAYFMYRKQEDEKSKNLMSIEDVKWMLKKDFAERRKKILALEVHVKQLADIISTIQSRVRVLSEERRDTNFMEQK